MKTAIDNNGFEIEVTLDTPVKTIDGVHYLLSEIDLAEISDKEVKWQLKEPERITQSIINKRQKEYGTAESQLEYAVENGWDALVQRNYAIKLLNPK